jgi:hypothetical protein
MTTNLFRVSSAEHGETRQPQTRTLMSAAETSSNVTHNPPHSPDTTEHSVVRISSHLNCTSGCWERMKNLRFWRRQIKLERNCWHLTEVVTRRILAYLTFDRQVLPYSLAPPVWLILTAQEVKNSVTQYVSATLSMSDDQEWPGFTSGEAVCYSIISKTRLTPCSC